MKKFFIICFFLFNILSIFAQDKPELKFKKIPESSNKVNVTIDVLAKNYISVYMERNQGRFTIRIPGKNKVLLYSGALASDFFENYYSSHVNFVVNSNIYTTNIDLKNICNLAIPRLFNNDTNKLSVTYYECDGVEIRQELIPKENIAKKAGAVLIKYIFKNNSNTTKWVGAALKLDTYIGTQDSAMLATPVGLIRNQQEVNPIPDYWLAFENIEDTSALIGRGTLRGKELVCPDFLFVGNSEYLHYYKYDEPLQSGDPYIDSEILLRWNRRELKPGDSTYISTLYGMAEIEYQGNTLSLYCSSPYDTLTVDANSDYEINPFDYLASVRNPGLTINNVKAVIKFNNNTFYLKDPADTVRYWQQILGGEQKLASWKIYTKNQCSSKEETIKVLVTGESADTNFCTTKIYVPANRLYTLTLNADPIGGGIAEKFPNRPRYECNVPVTITATPNKGYKFIGWEGDYPGDKMENPKTFYLDTNKVITAKFMVDSFNLEIRVSPVGAGTTKPSVGIHRYKNGDNVELSYEADPCYQFVGWKGDTTASENRIIVNMWKNKSITAEFKIKTYRITGDVVGSGTINIYPSPTNSDGTYNCGDSVTLRAIPSNCYDFDKWAYKIGNDTGSISINPIGFRIYNNINGTAYFRIKKFTLTTLIDPIGSGVITRSPDKTEYDCGDVVTISVKPDKCYNFVKWDDGDVSNPRTITMDKGSVSYKALLVKKNYTAQVTTDYSNSAIITKAPNKDTLACGDTLKISLTDKCPYSFIKWNDNVSTRNRSVVMDTNKVFIAKMAKVNFDVIKSEPNIFPNIVVDLKVDSTWFTKETFLIKALNRNYFTVIDEDSIQNRKTITNFNLLENANGYQIVYSLYGNCFNKPTDLNRKSIVTFSYLGCSYSDTAKYKINLNAGCDSCSRILKRKTPNMLFANRPNPFNPETIIRYSIENDDRVNLIVYDILGREVAVLVDEFKEAGEYEVSFIPKGLPSGVYLYRIKTSRFQDVKKMMYLK
ncbi:MAG TPA: T9SS type A sorting domain-containing protein [Bacteroidota bacterium]|jgi:hypothetical protein|nr:T9SS type A sorting domain-containing protein [Bacteroidota bacterium]